MNNILLDKLFPNEISCVFATDNNYVPYLSIAIQSIVENSDSNNMYGIYVLEENLTNANKRKLKFQEKENLKITFVNIKYLIDKYRTIFHLHDYVTVATYFRFFIPELFKNFDKLIYLDCDLVINCDIANLYNINLKNKIVACVQDIQILSWNYKKQISKQDKKYYLEILRLNEIDNYFNAGVMVFDIKKLRDFEFTQKCIKFLKKIKTPKFADQCILNSILCNNVMLLDFKWNFQNAIAYSKYSINDYKNIVKDEYVPNLIGASNAPYIMHYICIKPWDDIDLVNGEFFWKYARKSPYYETIYLSLLKNNFSKIKRKNKKKIFSLQKIFSIRNEYKNNQKYKILTICGIKLMFKIEK